MEDSKPSYSTQCKVLWNVQSEYLNWTFLPRSLKTFQTEPDLWFSQSHSDLRGPRYKTYLKLEPLPKTRIIQKMELALRRQLECVCVKLMAL